MRKLLFLILLAVLYALPVSAQSQVDTVPQGIEGDEVINGFNEEIRKIDRRLRDVEDNATELVSKTEFATENSKTISGLLPGNSYLLIIDLQQVANNEELVFYPNGTLSTIETTTDYNATGSTKLRLHNTSGFGSGTRGQWQIRFKTFENDATKIGVIMDGFDDATDTRHSVYAILNSDQDLSSVKIEGLSGTMTLKGVVYLYRYAKI